MERGRTEDEERFLQLPSTLANYVRLRHEFRPARALLIVAGSAPSALLLCCRQLGRVLRQYVERDSAGRRVVTFGPGSKRGRLLLIGTGEEQRLHIMNGQCGSASCLRCLHSLIESITFGAPSAASRSSLGGAAPENASGGASSRRVPPSGFVPMYQAGAFERVPVPGLRCVRCGDSIRGVPIAGKPGPMHFGCFCDDASSASMSIRVSESTGGNALTSCHACGRFEEHRFEFKKCSRCNEVWYCSRGCQKTDWATHKHVCSSLAAASDSLSQVQSTAPQTPPAAQRPVQPPPLPQFRPRRRHPADSRFLSEQTVGAAVGASAEPLRGRASVAPQRPVGGGGGGGGGGDRVAHTRASFGANNADWGQFEINLDDEVPDWVQNLDDIARWVTSRVPNAIGFMSHPLFNRYRLVTALTGKGTPSPPGESWPIYLLDAQPTAAAVYTEEQHGEAGRDAQPSRGAVLEEYNPSTNRWESVFAGTPDDYVRDPGNNRGGAVLEEYNPSTDTWESSIPEIPVHGNNRGGAALEAYNPSTSTWESTPGEKKHLFRPGTLAWREIRRLRGAARSYLRDVAELSEVVQLGSDADRPRIEPEDHLPPVEVDAWVPAAIPVAWVRVGTGRGDPAAPPAAAPAVRVPVWEAQVKLARNHLRDVAELSEFVQRDLDEAQEKLENPGLGMDLFGLDLRVKNTFIEVSSSRVEKRPRSAPPSCLRTSTGTQAKAEEQDFAVDTPATLQVYPQAQERWWFKTLDPLDPIFESISEGFRNSFRSHRLRKRAAEWCDVASVEVTSIQLVASPDVRDRYHRMLGREDASRIAPLAVDATPLDPTLNEFLLYHGTTNEAIGRICEEGFDPRIRRRGCTRPMLGEGIYFASAASKADQYASPSQFGFRRQILTRVCLGKAYQTRRSLRDQAHPPLYRDDEARERMYGSVLGLTRAEGGALDFREYVVYDGARSLPAAVITYRHTPGCRCHVCRGGM